MPLCLPLARSASMMLRMKFEMVTGEAAADGMLLMLDSFGFCRIIGMRRGFYPKTRGQREYGMPPCVFIRALWTTLGCSIGIGAIEYLAGIGFKSAILPNTLIITHINDFLACASAKAGDQYSPITLSIAGLIFARSTTLNLANGALSLTVSIAKISSVDRTNCPFPAISISGAMMSTG